MKYSNYERQSKTEQDLLRRLDGLVSTPLATDYIAAVIARVDQRMTADPNSIEEWEPLPIGLFAGLPSAIRSAWVFILGANRESGFERHPNSHQRVMSYRGSGNFQVGYPDTTSNHLLSDRTLGIERRWLSIPVNEWHQAVVPTQNWVVVSFHTVLAAELIEERPTNQAFLVTKQRTYLS